MKIPPRTRFIVPAALTATGADAFAPVVPHRALDLVIAVAVAVATAVVAAFRRGSLWASLAAWPVLGVATSLAAGTPEGNLIADAVDAPRTLLTGSLPVTATPGLLFWLFSVVWWVAYWTSRATAGSTTRALALIPPTLLLAAGTAASISVSASAIGLAVVFAALAVLALRPEAAGIGIGDVLRLTLAVVVAGAAAQVAAWAPARVQPVNPRAAVARPVRTQQLLSPLAQADMWAAGRAEPVLRVRSASMLPLRLTVLDRYDGVEWTSDDTYLPSGPKLPGAPAAAGTRRYTADIDLQGLGTAWLPAPDRPVELSGAPAAVSPSDGVLAAPAGRGSAGLSYRVISAVPELSAAAAARAAPTVGSAYAPYLSVPSSFPAAMTRSAQQITAQATSPYQQLLLLQNALRSGYRHDPRATPGRTVGHLSFFYLTSRTGTAGQFAATFALMARCLGFPARLAIGFTAGHPIAGGWSEVYSTDVAVWPEVALQGLGWVPFYPIPAPGHGVQGGVAEPSSRAAMDDAMTPGRRAVHPSQARPQHTATRRTAVSSRRTRPPWPPIAAAAVALLACCPLAIWCAGWLARRRERSGPPQHQIAAAWRLSRGELARLSRPQAAIPVGAGPPASDVAGPPASDVAGPPASDVASPSASLAAMTAEETIQYARDRLGPRSGETLRQLAELMSSSAFSPRPAHAGEAAAAWLAHRRLHADVGAAIGRRGQLRRSLEFRWHRTGGGRK